MLTNSAQSIVSIAKPKLPVRVKVIQALIRSSQVVVNVCTIVKNIWDKAMEVKKVFTLIICCVVGCPLKVSCRFIFAQCNSCELQELARDGHGVFIDKETMAKDLVLPVRNCFSAFVKNNTNILEGKFFEEVHEGNGVVKDLNRTKFNDKIKSPSDTTIHTPELTRNPVRRYQINQINHVSNLIGRSLGSRDRSRNDKGDHSRDR